MNQSRITIHIQQLSYMSRMLNSYLMVDIQGSMKGKAGVGSPDGV